MEVVPKYLGLFTTHLGLIPSMIFGIKSICGASPKWLSRLKLAHNEILKLWNRSQNKLKSIQYHSFIWKRSILDTWQHHRVVPLNTQLIAIKMNPKPFLLSQIIHLFQNCVHLKKIVTFPSNFGHYKHFPPKFQILVV